jgi:hypothetical protein
MLQGAALRHLSNAMCADEVAASESGSYPAKRLPSASVKREDALSSHDEGTSCFRIGNHFKHFILLICFTLYGFMCGDVQHSLADDRS